MYKECKCTESVQRQNKIANCFYEMLEEYSYEDITITELCKRTNIPRNTFYRYFANKNSILQYLLEDTLIKLLETTIHMPTNTPTDAIEYLSYWLRHYRQHDRLWSLVHFGSKHQMMLTQMIKYYIKLKDSSFKEDFRNFQTKQIIFLSYGMQGILDFWKHTNYEQNEREIAKQLYQLFQAPLMNIHPTGNQAIEMISKHMENNYLFEEYNTIH